MGWDWVEADRKSKGRFMKSSVKSQTVGFKTWRKTRK